MNEAKPRPVLELKNLTVAYRQDQNWLAAVQDVSLCIEAGQTYGLVGESGSGKSTLVLAVMRYLGENGAVQGGKIELQGQDLLALDEAQMRKVWGRQVAMVPQNPLTSLNPAIQIGEQMAEALRYQIGLSAAEAHRQTLALLKRVHIPDPQRVAASYPHQLSGGMQQRVLIAMAISTEPTLLILDEPTTNLDVTTQAVILDLVGELIEDNETTGGMAVLYVTHNLGVVAQICDQVGVIYAGELVEEALVKDLFANPIHPYTQGLLNSAPLPGQSKYTLPLQSIPGQIPQLGKHPSGCIFAQRCPLVIEICDQRPALTQIEAEQRVRCHRWEEIFAGKVQAWQPNVVTVPMVAAAEGEQAQMLTLQSVSVQFPVRRSLGEVLRREPHQMVQAVREVSLGIKPGETLGLVGESGSGKTTLARVVVGLIEKSAGSIELLTVELPGRLSQRPVGSLRHLQMVFQNPEEALNPHLTVGESLRRPLITLQGYSPQDADRKVGALLQAVRLPPSYKNRLPGQLSGGEKQRIAIARAFAANPELLITDEAVSSLDVSVQAAVLNLLDALQREHNTSLLFISHNLAVVGYLADRIAVMYLGNLVEIADSTTLFQPPYHPYTEALLSAIPSGDPEMETTPIHLEGEIPSLVEVADGCPFHTRCPRYLGELCAAEMPPWQTDDRTGKRYRCHIKPDDLSLLQSAIMEHR
jgi:peptide/nickel transport system ATP-binding protein